MGEPPATPPGPSAATARGRGAAPSQEQLAAILSIASDAFITLDAAQRITFFNDGAERIFGYVAADVVGMPLDILIPERYRSSHRRHVESFADSGVIARRMGDRLEIAGLRRSGDEFPAEASISKLESDGSILFTVVLRDVTDRRRAEQALRRSEEQLAEAQDFARLGSWEWDIRRGHVTWSDALYRVYGLEPRSLELNLESFLERVHPDDREDVRAAIQRCHDTHAPFSLEHRIVGPDGRVSVIHARGQVVLDDTGEPVRMFGTGQDITERIEAEQQAWQLMREQAARIEAEAAAGRLRESEARFRSMADTAPVLIWVSDTTAACEWFNRPWLEFTGRTLEQESGDGWRASIHPRDLQRCVDTYLGSFERREPFRMGYRLRRYDGQYRWFLDHGVPRFTPEGEFAGYIGSCIDVHEQFEQQRALEENSAHLEQIRMELERTVAALQARTVQEQAARGEAESARRIAEEASRAKSQFLAVMSHELRTPLNAILGFADLLDGEIGGPLTERQRDHVGRIQSSSWHLLELINQLLSLSRIEAGKEDVRLSTVDVGALARDTAGLIEPAAVRKGLQLRVDAPAEPIHARTDAGKLRQILLNLLNNAVKFTEAGELQLSIALVDGRVRIEVRDTGIGIPADFLDRVFEPFTQVDPSSPRGRGGTGLGLSVTRELTRLLGGEVALASELGHGSTFTVVLPAAHALESAADDDGLQAPPLGT